MKLLPKLEERIASNDGLEDARKMDPCDGLAYIPARGLRQPEILPSASWSPSHSLLV